MKKQRIPKRKVHFIPPYFSQPVHEITVSLIGCGGTGSCMLVNLGRIHSALVQLGHPGLHVIAFDGDNVSETNVGRQRFSKADIGFNKATVLITRINNYYGLSWEAMPQPFNHPFMTNIAISCVDTAAARREFARLARKDALTHLRDKKGDDVNIEPYEKKYYWLDIGNSRQTGQIVLGTIGKYHKEIKSKKYRSTRSLLHVIEKFPELKTMKDENTGPSCSMEEALGNQDLFINSILAEYAGKIVWSLFRKQFLTTHGLFVNIETGNTQPIKIS